MALKKILSRCLKTFNLSVLTFFCASPMLAAEKIAFNYPPFGEFYVSVKDLEIFATEGKITSGFSYYAEKVTANDLKQLRGLLTRPFPLNQFQLYNFLNSELGDILIAQLSKLINNPSKQSEPALRGALISAAQNPEGLTILDVLREYPLPTIDVNLSTVIESVESTDKILNQTNLFFEWVSQRNSNIPGVKLPKPFETLTQAGKVTWSEKRFKVNRSKAKPIEVLVYLPDNLNKPAPVVVIAPGLNSNFNSLTYAAQHLASHGYGIIALNFPETDSQSVSEFLTGLGSIPKPGAWITQPQDVTVVLDYIAKKLKSDPTWNGKLDLNTVGILGHSLGGYTSLALGGAEIAWSNLIRRCQDLKKPEQVILNPALIWQCRGLESSSPPKNMEDQRIKAVIALNPVSSPIFSRSSMKSFELPVMIISGSTDIFAPSISEQVKPFTWLSQRDKYLALVTNSTHLTFLQGTDNLPEAIVGKQPSLAHSYLKALSLAFFNLYLKNESQYRPYLSESSVRSLSENPLYLYLLRNLTPEELQRAIKTEE